MVAPLVPFMSTSSIADNTPTDQTLPGHPSLHFRRLPAVDLPRAAELEATSYPADEAATPEGLQYRQRVAPELFYGVYEDKALIGFVVSTAAPGDKLEEETMSTHTPGGASICVHSVVVAASHRRRGIARAMVRAYVDVIAADKEHCGSARSMLLLAHAPLLGLYVQCGFDLLGPSAVVHGPEQWFDMHLDLVAKRQLEFVQVDAFSSVPFAGNPAAVLFTQKGGCEEWMQAVAIENNLSETAFLEERSKPDNSEASSWDIRWFTPGGEVALCGHATLASAHALWDTGRVAADKEIIFHTRKSGMLRCTHLKPFIRMDFPAQPPTAACDGLEKHKGELAAALCVDEHEILYLGRGPPSTPDWLVEISPSAFACMEPNLGALSQVKPMDRGVIVTCAGAQSDGVGPVPTAPKRPRILSRDAGHSHAAERFDFLSRFFAPTLGIGEDPVTGSAHCVLAPYWAAKLRAEDGAVLHALQASPRGGILQVRHHAKTSRVEIEGQAITVIRGRMAV